MIAGQVNLPSSIQNSPGIYALVDKSSNVVWVARSINMLASILQSCVFIYRQDKRIAQELCDAFENKRLDIEVMQYVDSSDVFVLQTIQRGWVKHYEDLGYKILNRQDMVKYYLKIVSKKHLKYGDNPSFMWHVMLRRTGGATKTTVGVFRRIEDAKDWIKRYYGLDCLKGKSIDRIVYAVNKDTKNFLSNPAIKSKFLKEDLDRLIKEIGKS